MTLLILLAMAMAAAMAASRQRIRAATQSTAADRKTPSDQIRPLPRHIPIVDSKIYS